MKNDLYFVFYNGEDGVSSEVYTKNEMNNLLNNGTFEGAKFNAKLPEDWQHVDADGYYIIQGKLVVPKPISKITEWELP